MERKTSHRARRLRTLVVTAALGTSLLAGALPADAAPDELPQGLERAGERANPSFGTEGWLWIRAFEGFGAS